MQMEEKKRGIREAGSMQPLKTIGVLMAALSMKRRIEAMVVAGDEAYVMKWKKPEMKRGCNKSVDREFIGIESVT